MAVKGSIPKTMKALVAYSKDDYRLELEYPTPECGPDDIIIKTEACGVCAGDLKCKHGAAMFWGDDVQPSWVKPPFIPGHEFFGRIVQMGENVTGYEPTRSSPAASAASARTATTGCASPTTCWAISITTTAAWPSMSAIPRPASSAACPMR